MSDRFPDMPARMRSLPVDRRGFPVPWFVAWNEQGEPVFPAMDPAKFKRAVQLSMCWVCGQKLGRFRASVIGPMCAINRTISEPQSHVDCAQFSARHCPFLANPRMGRVPVAKAEGKLGAAVVDAAGEGIKRNPGACAVWVEETPTKLFRAEGGTGYLFKLGDPSRVEWYANGREATRDEVTASINSGLPLLEEMCDQDRDPEGAHEELQRRRFATVALLPAC